MMDGDYDDDDWDDDGDDDDMFDYEPRTLSKVDLDIFRTITGHNVSYAVEYEIGGVTKFDNVGYAACWGGFRGGLPDYTKKAVTPKNLYACLHTGQGYEHVTRPYWNFIFDKDKSPWRSLLDKGESFEWESTIGLAANKAANTPLSYVKIPLKKTTNMQTLVSLLITSRVGADIPSTLGMFSALSEAGWDALDAFYVSLYVGYNNNKQIEDICGRDYYSFTARYDNCYEYLKNGTPNVDPIRVLGSDYGFLQQIWMKQTYDKGKMPDQLPATTVVSVLNGSGRKYTGMFPKRFEFVNKSKNLARRGLRSLPEIIKMKDEIIHAIKK